MAVHTGNTSSQEAEVGGWWWGWGQSLATDLSSKAAQGRMRSCLKEFLTELRSKALNYMQDKTEFNPQLLKQKHEKSMT